MASLGLLILEALLLLIGLGVASELLAIGSHVLEKQFGAGFTGSVILGFITMLPELIFVLIVVREAAAAPTPEETADLFDVALGSAVGGNILLFTIGYGMVILLAWWKHKQVIKLPVTLRDDLWYLLIASIYLLITSFKGYFTWWDGAILFAMYLIFVVHQYIETKNLDLVEKEHEETTRKEWGKSISFMVVGGIAIVLMAEPFVHVIVESSKELGISPLILALVVSPIASELPEKISAFSLSYKSMAGAQVAVANFVGSKVQASTLLFGTMVLYAYVLTGESFEVGKNFGQIMIAVLTTLYGVFITYDLKLNIKEGIVVTILYAVSIFASILFLA